MKHLLRFGMLAVLLSMVAVVGVQAAPAAAPLAIGVVDMDKLQQGYKGFEAAMTSFQAYTKSREDVFTGISKGEFLTPDQFKEFSGLTGQPVRINTTRIDELEGISKKTGDEYQALVDKVKANLSDPEKARLAELENAPSADGAKEHDALIQKGKDKLTDAEKARLKELDDNHQLVVSKLNDLVTGYRKDINDEKTRLLTLLTDKVQQAIGVVAKDQKVSIVLNKTVSDGQQTSAKLVLWGGTDLTEAALKNLNDNFKPEMLQTK